MNLLQRSIGVLGVVGLIAASAQGQAVIYEPFDYDLGGSASIPVSGNDGGAGFDGAWTNTKNNPAVVEPGETWGSLPVAGGTSRGSAWSGLSRPIGSTLADANLLDDGATLWFSAIFDLTGANLTNADLALALGNADKFVSNVFGDRRRLDGDTEGIGITHRGGNINGAIWQDAASDGVAEETLESSSLTLNAANGTIGFIAGKIEWGVGATAGEKMTLYAPDTSLNQGAPIMAETTFAALDQSTFDTLLIQYKDSTPKLDEIRFGATFDDVIGAASCTPGDTDGDGDIDTGDLTTSIQNFTGAGGSTTKTCEEGDTDEDGDVDTGDLTFSIQNFTGAQAGNAGVPDLVYDPATGNVTIDADGADVISFSLQSGPFNAADFSELPAGLTDNIASQIGWTSFNLFSGLTGTADLGAILPAGLDQAGLEAALTTASYGLALAGGGGGGRLDLIIPEPASMVLMGLGAVALVRRRRAA